MRRAFVLHLGPESDPANHEFAGSIEEVDTGAELRFRSTAQLLVFLQLRLERTGGSNSGSSETISRELRGTLEGDQQ